MAFEFSGPVVTGLIILGVVFAVIFITAALWKRIPQSKAAVVTGIKKRVISGGGGFVIPIFERYDIISLENIQVVINIDGAISEQGVPVSVRSVAVVKVKSDKESILTAMEQFFRGGHDKTTKVIEEQSELVLLGKLREIIAKMTVEDLNRDKDKFISEVQGNAARDLAGMGLEIKAFTVKDISDKNGYLEALGREQIAAVKRHADIAEAEAQRETRIKVAEANRLGEEAELLAATQVAEATKEKELKIQGFKKEEETARAVAALAYQIQENKTKQEVTETEVAVQLTRTQRETEVATQEALRKAEELKATVNAQADAELYRRQQQAAAAKAEEVAKAQAEAHHIELDGTATATVIKAKGQAEADAIKAKGKAEADAILAKGLAEAEAMDKKAEALKKYGEAAVTQLIVEQLPNIAREIAAPISNIEKIVAIDGGSNSGGGANKITGYVTDLMSQLPEVVESLTGQNITSLIGSVLTAGQPAVKEAPPTEQPVTPDKK